MEEDETGSLMIAECSLRALPFLTSAAPVNGYAPLRVQSALSPAA